jgi:non-ribosomal peptide synthetase component E (peptide arylation enzyme)
MKCPIFATLLLLFLASCQPQVPKSTTVEGTYTLQSHGITYHVPPQKSAKVDDSDGDYSYTGDTLSFTVKKGKLTVNGQEAGTVRSGDTVTIDSKGTVTINRPSDTTE